LYLYGFSIKKSDAQISVTSPNKALIEEEYEKMAAAFLGIDIADVIATKKTLSIVAAQTRVETQPKVDVETVDEIPEPQSDENVISIPQLPKTKTIKRLPANFATMLAEKEKAENNNVIEKKESELKNTYVQMQNLIKEKHLETEIDYIVSAAYCLTHYENALRFNEEQIVAKISPFSDVQLNHDSILDATAKNLLRVVPDFTGVSDTIEYELTEYGEEYFLNELSK